MIFQYMEGDFPHGTIAENRSGDWFLLTSKGSLFKSAQRVPLRANIKTAAIVQAHSGNDIGSRLKRGLQSGAGAANQLGQKAGAAAIGGLLAGPLGFVAGAAVFGQREVPVQCVLKDNKFFLAKVSMMNYDWLATQSLMNDAANRFRNSDFAEATMALCALVASADGVVDDSEKRQVETFIASHEVLKLFPASELKQKFAFYCDKIKWDAASGKVQATQAISKLVTNEDQARAAILIGISIANADGNFDPNEQKVVKDVCGLLRIYPGEFGLYYN